MKLIRITSPVKLLFLPNMSFGRHGLILIQGVVVGMLMVSILAVSYSYSMRTVMAKGKPPVFLRVKSYDSSSGEGSGKGYGEHSEGSDGEGSDSEKVSTTTFPFVKEHGNDKLEIVKDRDFFIRGNEVRVSDPLTVMCALLLNSRCKGQSGIVPYKRRTYNSRSSFKNSGGCRRKAENHPCRAGEINSLELSPCCVSSIQRDDNSVKLRLWRENSRSVFFRNYPYPKEQSSESNLSRLPLNPCLLTQEAESTPLFY